MPTNKTDKPRVAIVHDWLIGGGAERVVMELHNMYPDAPIYTSYCSSAWRQKLDNKVVTGWLQYWPFSKLRKFIPFLRIWWFTRLRFDDFDLVISSSGAEAKGIRTPANVVHINYCHAPTHYYWNRYNDYLKNPGFGIFNGLARFGLKTLVEPLRRWDYRAAQRPNYMIANSTFTQDEIKKYYGRDSVVVHPPIDTERFSSSSPERHGFVITGRQTPYKRVDLAVKACTDLSLDLTVIGKGPDHRRLQSLAGPTITFLTGVSDVELASHLSAAQAFIFPGVDDFGIAAVEAMAAGTPIVAYKAGGALDYVINGETGRFFEEQSVESLSKVLAGFRSGDFNSAHIRQAATAFSTKAFQKSMFAIINKLV
ncbi:MAG: glycosyltransferase [Candidatus Saccharibacteria bacterium]|nr:glycosyltransferase [Candidatus Saccharibacteria bacterium]